MPGLKIRAGARRWLLVIDQEDMRPRGKDAKVLKPSRNAGIALLVVGLALAGGGGWLMKDAGRFSLPHLVMLFGTLVVAAAIEHFLSGIVLLPDRLEYGVV